MSWANGHIGLDDDWYLTGIASPFFVADGSVWSIQAGPNYCCLPRVSISGVFDCVEVQVLKGDHPASWQPWRRGAIYAWLDVQLIDAEVIRRGGPM